MFCFSFPSLSLFSRALTEEEIVDLQERHYDSIAEKQKDVDRKIQREVSGAPCSLDTRHEACWWVVLTHVLSAVADLRLHKYKKNDFKVEAYSAYYN